MKRGRLTIGCWAKGMRIRAGTGQDKDLNRMDILEQMKMYIAAVRMADFFGVL